MPTADGSLKTSEKIMLGILTDRVIPVPDGAPSPSTFGIVEPVMNCCMQEDRSRKSLIRVIDAMNLDMLAQAVGGWVAMSTDEQTHSLLLVEHALPEEFSDVLTCVRNVYYSLEQTPEQPASFDSDDEIFGKVEIEEAPRSSQNRERRAVL